MSLQLIGSQIPSSMHLPPRTLPEDGTQDFGSYVVLNVSSIYYI